MIPEMNQWRRYDNVLLLAILVVEIIDLFHRW